MRRRIRPTDGEMALVVMLAAVGILAALYAILAATEPVGNVARVIVFVLLSVLAFVCLGALVLAGGKDV